MAKQPESAEVDPKLLQPESDLPPDADIEERFNDFWKKNGLSIFGAIALGGLIVIGFQVYQYLQIEGEKATQAAFASAETLEDKFAFVEAHPDHNLAGIALLEAADAAYSEGDFATAATRYADARERLGGTPFAARATLGEGMAQLRAGTFEAGQQTLNSLSLRVGVLDHFRAEAAYHLAVARWEAGDLEGARQALEIIFALETPGGWEARATQLEAQMPAA